MTEREKMIKGLPYNANDKKLVNDRLDTRKLIREFNNSVETELNKRNEILKL